MSRARRLCVASVAALMLLPASASAFEQTKTCNYERNSDYECGPGESPKGVHWGRRCVQYKVNVRGSAGIPTGPDGQLTEALLTNIVESFDIWNRADCSNFRMEYAGLTTQDLADFDSEGGIAGNENTITWLDDWPYDRSAYALTSVTFDARNGRIQDADIELNDDVYQFTDDDNNIIVDVRNTMTHEVGHLLGLDHSNERDATMFFSAAEGETKKRSLEQDDVDGLCTIYPDGEGELSCTRDEAAPGGDDVSDDALCATVGAASALPGAWTLLAALFGWRRTRRGRGRA